MIRRAEPVVVNDQDTAQNVADNSETQHSNQDSYKDDSLTYVNSTQNSTNSQPPDKVDGSGDYSSLYPPPPSLSLPPFNAIPYPLPLTGATKNCPVLNNSDGLTISLPSDLYTGKINQCGQKVVVVFEPLAGQRWSGAKDNLTVSVTDSFKSDGHSELERTVLLSETAWKEVTGSSFINKFESWPIRWFFVDSNMQKETADGTHENQGGEDDDLPQTSTSDNQTRDGDGYATTTSTPIESKSNEGFSNRTASDGSTDQYSRGQTDDDSSEGPSHPRTRPSMKRSLLSRRSSRKASSQQHLLSALNGVDEVAKGLDGDVEGLLSGGWATYFTQGGRPGACGHVHKDSDVIVALDYRRYGAVNQVSSHCDKTVEITRVSSGKTITAKVADACPTCENKNSLDLSEGAFEKLATKDEGMVSIEWKFSD
ncbi:hypothetical protein CROQUDRAFT_65595 [Cronartium quercuum f. sp. fusiforme G11]|uniref:RlpA-like protein double-psi beta-barrel domain-containing protein n=1 Tax=Cronartium quercuum f. sp. fusiforme G11 TaxID=708437 RepID=A0A9P6NC80_9BASI|nr:hypothetical protein CROQUDRAFT_65595 [Cronartium quercuum f. sp. fusiforme G11]